MPTLSLNNLSLDKLSLMLISWIDELVASLSRV